MLSGVQDTGKATIQCPGHRIVDTTHFLGHQIVLKVHSGRDTRKLILSGEPDTGQSQLSGITDIWIASLQTIAAATLKATLIKKTTIFSNVYYANTNVYYTNNLLSQVFLMDYPVSRTPDSRFNVLTTQTQEFINLKKEISNKTSRSCLKKKETIFCKIIPLRTALWASGF